MEQNSFGRRGPKPAFSGAIKTPVSRSGIFAERAGAPEPARIAFDSAEDRSVDEDLREWKKARRENIRLPWRQISFMASICFGVASFVLPASVNDILEWPLLALGAFSLVGGFSLGKTAGSNQRARAAASREPGQGQR